MNKKGFAVTQSVSLLLAIFAFAFLIGIPGVSAVDTSKDTCVGSCADKTQFECVSAEAPFSDVSWQTGKCLSKPNDFNYVCCPSPAVLSPKNFAKDESYVKTPNQVQSPENSGSKKTPASELAAYAGGAYTLYDKGSKIKEKAAELLAGKNSVIAAEKQVSIAQKELTAAIEEASKSTSEAAAEAAQAKVDAAKAKLESAHKELTAAKKKAAEATYQESGGTVTGKTKAPTDFQTYFKKGNFWTIKDGTMSTGGYIAHTAGVAIVSAAIITQIFKIAGASERNRKQISTAAWTGAAATTTYAALSKALLGSKAVLLGPGFTAAIVVGTTLIWTALTYQNFAQEQISYKVSVWQPEEGGERCHECNDLRYGCSEYQCKTYGTACGIVNPGTEYEECIWENEDDIKPPIVSPLPEILDSEFKFTPETTMVEERGVKLVQNGGCIEPFHNVYFGVKTDEPAQCKIDVERKRTMDEMSSYMIEGPVYTFNHTLQLPSSAFPSNYSMTEAGWTVNPDDDYAFYIRCTDPNGNDSPHHFVVTFCVDDGPDTTAPEITTNYLQDAYITSGQSTIDDLEVYTNEPADCRWSHNDKEYDDMEYEMQGCSQNLGDYTFPSRYSYGCNAILTGLVDDEVNNFYIRCKDKPTLTETDKERRVANEESYKLSLQGTKELVIDEIMVNDEEAYTSDGEGESSLVELIDSTTNIKAALAVRTSQGAGKTGESRCTYQEIPSKLKFEFYNEGSFEYMNTNTHDLYLEEGYYGFDIECCDLANNCDSEVIQINVDTDTESPEVARAYYEEGNMKIVTNEDAECAYALDTCNYLFEDGVTFQTRDNIDHFTNWDTSEDLYVKCKDRFGNIEADSCSIIVRATDKYSGANTDIKEDIEIDF